MKLKKINLFLLIALLILTMSVSLMDFENMSWAANVKSYLGFILSVVMIIIYYLYLRKRLD
jgi:amino acid permease